MSSVSVRSTVGDLQRDLARKSKEAPPLLRRVVSKGIRVGNTVARDFARESAGSHGKLYPRSFSSEMFGEGPSLSGGRLYAGTYGPDASMPQGDMSFEWGSRKQKPHLDLNRSADLIGGAMVRETRDVVDRLFW